MNQYNNHKARRAKRMRQAWRPVVVTWSCLLYTSDAADERSSVDLGGRRIINKKKNEMLSTIPGTYENTSKQHYENKQA